mgnify:CR=1 FL=1
MAKLLPKVLSNGIRVWSHYNQTPLVAIGVLIDAGTRDEGPMMKGAAQLIRHNAFMVDFHFDSFIFTFFQKIHLLKFSFFHLFLSQQKIEQVKECQKKFLHLEVNLVVNILENI